MFKLVELLELKQAARLRYCE